MKVPLLEYLDKLEAHANSGVLPLVNGKRLALDRDAALALIAKLRELANFASAYWPHIFGEDAPLEIEVLE